MTRTIAIEEGSSGVIQAHLDTPKEPGNDDLILFVPGLLEQFDAPLLMETARLCNDAGFATIRINSRAFYGFDCGLNKASIGAQTRDLERVLVRFAPTHKRIIVIAHSTGAFPALLAAQSAAVLVLWDPSLHPREIFANTAFDSKRDTYYDPELREDVSCDLMQELPTLPTIAELSKRTPSPVGVISAGRGAIHAVEPYIQNLPALVKHVVINEADHNFSSSEQRNVLIRETLSIIKRAILPIADQLQRMPREHARHLSPKVQSFGNERRKLSGRAPAHPLS